MGCLDMWHLAAKMAGITYAIELGVMTTRQKLTLSRLMAIGDTMGIEKRQT